MNTVPMREPDPNDDMGVTIDAILTRPALRIRYMKGDFDDWKSIIGDEDLEYGIRQLPEKEQAILEKYYLQQKTLLDISRDLDIPASVIGGYLIAIDPRVERCIKDPVDFLDMIDAKVEKDIKKWRKKCKQQINGRNPSM